MIDEPIDSQRVIELDPQKQENSTIIQTKPINETLSVEMFQFLEESQVNKPNKVLNETPFKSNITIEANESVEKVNETIHVQSQTKKLKKRKSEASISSLNSMDDIDDIFNIPIKKKKMKQNI